MTHCENCNACQECQLLYKAEIKAEVKDEVKKDLLNALLPLFSKFFSGSVDEFNLHLNILQEESCKVADSWEQHHTQVIDEQINLISSVEDLREAKLRINKIQEEVPVLKHRVDEISHSDKANEMPALEVQKVEKLSKAKDLTGVCQGAMLDSGMMDNFLKVRIELLEKEKDEMKNQMKEVKKENKVLQRDLENTKQYQRREILELHNIVYSMTGKNATEKEVIDFLYYELGVEISPNDISTCHRVHTPRALSGMGAHLFMTPLALQFTSSLYREI